MEVAHQLDANGVFARGSFTADEEVLARENLATYARHKTVNGGPAWQASAVLPEGAAADGGFNVYMQFLLLVLSTGVTTVLNESTNSDAKNARTDRHAEVRLR